MITNSICQCLLKTIESNVLILDLEDTVADQDTRLTAAEENIQGSSLFLIPNLLNY